MASAVEEVYPLPAGTKLKAKLSLVSLVVLCCSILFFIIPRIMKYFDSYDSLRKEDPKTFKLIGELGEVARYKSCGLDNGGIVWDMDNGGWFVINNPYFVTDAQWRTLALRHFAFESLQDLPLREIVKNFHYVQEVVVVGSDRFYIPNGCIDGHLQGMFMRINAEGEINT